MADASVIRHERRKTEALVNFWRELRAPVTRNQIMHALPDNAKEYCMWSPQDSTPKNQAVCGISRLLNQYNYKEKDAQQLSDRLAATLYGKLIELSWDIVFGMSLKMDEGSFRFERGLVHYRIAIVPTSDDANSKLGWLGIIDWSNDTI